MLSKLLATSCLLALALANTPGRRFSLFDFHLFRLLPWARIHEFHHNNFERRPSSYNPSNIDHRSFEPSWWTAQLSHYCSPPQLTHHINIWLSYFHHLIFRRAEQHHRQEREAKAVHRTTRWTTILGRSSSRYGFSLHYPSLLKRQFDLISTTNLVVPVAPAPMPVPLRAPGIYIHI